LTRLGTAHLP